MAAEQTPSGKILGAGTMPHTQEYAHLGWHDFVQSLVADRSPDRRTALPQGIQE